MNNETSPQDDTSSILLHVPNINQKVHRRPPEWSLIGPQAKSLLGFPASLPPRPGIECHLVRTRTVKRRAARG